MVLRGVEVDVVGHLERQLHRDLGQRDQVRLDHVPLVLVAHQLEQPLAGRLPGRATEREEVVQRRLVEQLRPVQHVGRRHRRQVDQLVPDRGADPRLFVGVPEHAEGQVVGPEGRAFGYGDPGHPRTSASTRPSAARSSSGSAMLHEPNDVNQRRTPLCCCSSSPRQRSASAAPSRFSSTVTTSSGPAPSRHERVASSTFRKPWCSKPVSAAVCRTAWCRPAVHLNGTSRSRQPAMNAATCSEVGNRSADSPPVRSLAAYPASATTSSARSQAPVRPISTKALSESMQSSQARTTRSALRDRSCSSRSEEHTSELQSRGHLVCRLLLEKKKSNPFLGEYRRTKLRRVDVT